MGNVPSNKRSVTSWRPFSMDQGEFSLQPSGLRKPNPAKAPPPTAFWPVLGNFGHGKETDCCATSNMGFWLGWIVGRWCAKTTAVGLRLELPGVRRPALTRSASCLGLRHLEVSNQLSRAVRARQLGGGHNESARLLLESHSFGGFTF